MNIAIEELSACRRRLSIEIPASEVEEESNRVLGEFQKFASIKGFRPGKAPKKMVANRYKQDIESEMKRKLVPKAFKEAVKQKDLRIVNTPNVEDLKYEPGISLSFSTTVDLAPEFSLPKYKGIRIENKNEPVTDEEVDKVVQNFLDQRADYEDVNDRSLQEGDFAVITYEGMLENKPLTDWLPDATQLAGQEKFWLWIKEDVFLPGFGKQLVGMKPGEDRKIEVPFPEDVQQEPLRGKTVTYSVHLEAVKVKILPELNDELAREVSGMEKEPLLKMVRENLERQKNDQARQHHVRQLLDHLKASVRFELPESSVEEETQNLIADIVRQNQQRGIPDHLMEEHKQDIITNAESSAQDRVRVNFILNRVADEEKLEVSHDEMAAELQALSQQYQIAPDKLIRRLEENGGILKLQEDIRRRKTVDFLLQSAEIA